MVFALLRFKDGIPVRPNANIRVEMTEDGRCRLTIAEVKSTDEGAYRCLATNIIGSSNSAAFLTVSREFLTLRLDFSLTIHINNFFLGEKQEKKAGGEAPSFLLPLRDTTVDSGSSVTLKCSVAGDPAPDVKWYSSKCHGKQTV